MPNIDMQGDAPVGAIVPFFGPVTDAITNGGWLPCDGASKKQDEWPDLFAAIGHAFGWTEKDVDFCLPDFRGLFLRGMDAGAGRDPGAKLRVAAGPKNTGNTGDAIGSFQVDATRMPASEKTGFTVTGKLDMDYHKTHNGCSHTNRISFNSDDGTIKFDGGDAESSPVNLNAIYLIKAKANSASDPTVGPIPMGAAIALPVSAPTDSPIDDYWRYCDGQSFIAAEGSTFYPLYQVVGVTNGGVKDGDRIERFAIPDLRGLYLRGAGKQDKVPAHRPRDTPRPDLSIPGNGGDDAGSYQDWSTAPPRTTGFSVKVQSYPFKSTDGYQAGAATVAQHTNDTTVIKAAGGEPETRPISLSVDWYLRFRTTPTGGGGAIGAELPVGVIVTAGTAADLTQWMPCHGQSVAVADYEPLFQVIGFTFGHDGDKTHFNLPDLRGRFLRGAGAVNPPPKGYPRPRGTPVAVSTIQADATGMPRRPFQVTLNNWPGDHTADVIAYGTLTALLKLSGEKTLTAQGGDAETRPFNGYVHHLIKVRS